MKFDGICGGMSILIAKYVWSGSFDTDFVLILERKLKLNLFGFKFWKYLVEVDMNWVKDHFVRDGLSVPI